VSIYHKITSRNTPDINPAIESGFLEHHNDPDIHKTHLFDGRYENIYLNDKHIPALKPLINEALSLAAEILAKECTDLKNLRAGYWFNYMPPGTATTLHTHDDDDELLSCVYYIKVPEDSGNLIIYDDSDRARPNKIEIKSRTGDFIFFKPDVRHEVTKNNSSEYRLSIAFNFGLNDHP
jgi:uncharacterized protein (TIGR02466 family)